MPVPTKLSHRLRDVLGDEAGIEMVDWMQRVDAQRAELRDLNELNFARIDARFREFGARLEQIETRFEQIDMRFDQVDTRFEQIDARFEQIDARFEQIDTRFDQIDARFDQIDTRFGQVDARFGDLESREALVDANIRRDMQGGFARLETRIEQRFADILKWSFAFWLGSVLTITGALAALSRFFA